jgi:protease II
MVNFENGVTPLNDTNLNKMQIGTSLYEDETGTNGQITFSEEIADGDEIEIIYCRRRASNDTSVYKTTGKIPYKSGMEIILDLNYYAADTNHQSIAKIVTVSDTKLTVSGENSVIDTSGTISIQATSTIYITKVIKY